MERARIGVLAIVFAVIIGTVIFIFYRNYISSTNTITEGTLVEYPMHISYGDVGGNFDL